MAYKKTSPSGFIGELDKGQEWCHGGWEGAFTCISVNFEIVQQKQ